MTASAETVTIYTIGHSNHSIERFVDLLHANGIKTVVDTRSMPYSRYSPHFCSAPLVAALRSAGFEYLFLGRELGGRPDDPRFYDANGYVLYTEIGRSAEFERALGELLTSAKTACAALLCSEEDPAVCHRKRLVARALRARGVSVMHIRGDGRVEPDAPETQPGLFGEEEEVGAWKSLLPIRSDLPKRTPNDFSRP